MIPGLDISQEDEERIWSGFARWSGYFRSDLKAGGVPYLIDRYRKLIESVETQSCLHGPGGARQIGRDWRYCCGITYKFAAEIQCRDALRIIQDLAPAAAISDLRQELAALDDRLYALYEDPPVRTGDWWNQKYPRGITDTGPWDLVGTWATAPSRRHGWTVDELRLHEDATFTGRCVREGGILNGRGTWTSRGGFLEFNTESGKISVAFVYRGDELLLYFGENQDRMVRFLLREAPFLPPAPPPN